jgi:hypothetical protein
MQPVVARILSNFKSSKESRQYVRLRSLAKSYRIYRSEYPAKRPSCDGELKSTRGRTSISFLLKARKIKKRNWRSRANTLSKHWKGNRWRTVHLKLLNHMYTVRLKHSRHFSLTSNSALETSSSWSILTDSGVSSSIERPELIQSLFASEVNAASCAKLNSKFSCGHRWRNI